MFYLPFLKNQFQGQFSLIESFAKLERNIFIVLDANERIVACNKATIKKLAYPTFESFQEKTTVLRELFIKEKGCFSADKSGWTALCSSSRDTFVKIVARNGKMRLYSLKVERIEFEDKHLFLVILEDRTVIEKAKQAKRYFDEFKKNFLTSISHEFRTPMNAIIGFSDLMNGSVLNPIQREYMTLIDKSAKNMMGNIENLLELMQAESGQLKLNETLFTPTQYFENFSKQYCAVAQDKKLQLFFMIDPHLPNTMMGDGDKIQRILKNLISNALKFTSPGGQILVEIKSKKTAKGVNVEYSVSDTGSGISKEQLSTILRPFASARGNQKTGKDGLGVGLSLSHKLINMMGSTLHVASKEGKGSRFFFDVEHALNEESRFEFVQGSKMAVYAEDKHTVLQSKLLKNYLENFEVAVHQVEGLSDEVLEKMDALFILTSHITKARITTLRSHYPNLQIIPVIMPQYEHKFNQISDLFESHLILPILPDNLFDCLSVIWKKVPKEFLKKTTSKGINNDQSARILVAEDNPINLKLLQTILLQNKYKVIAVDNGQKAVDLYLKESFDLILMDIDMPVMDGITATRLIHAVDKRQNKKSTPIVALTAHALSGDRERIMGAGLDAHLAKPIDKDFLLLTIENFLDKNTQENFALSEAV